MFLQLNAGDPQEDLYEVEGMGQCFVAEVGQVHVENGGKNFLADIRITGEITATGLKNTVCKCEARLVGSSSTRSDVEGDKLCNEALREGMEKRLENIKCKLERGPENCV